MTIYLLSGPLGVGKTTVARALAKELPTAQVIEADVYFGSLVDPSLTWETRLKLTWDHILATTTNYLTQGHDVIIDFVVETELKWFVAGVAAFHPTMKYVIFYSTPETLAARLKNRSESQYLFRSLTLLHNLTHDPTNQPYLYDTTHQDIDTIVTDIISSDRFAI